MKVRAKFRVTQLAKSSQGKGADGVDMVSANVQLSPVMPTYDRSLNDGKGGYVADENQAFWKATPSGRIELGLSPNVPAADAFELSKEYYVDFTPVEEAPAE